MSKLIVSEIESTGSSVQINDDLKVGSTGTNLITSGNVVGPSEDMIKNFKAFENPITVYDAAVSSTAVPGFTNAVPYVTSTSTGLTSTTALAATSTGNSLLTNFSADAIYVYNSSGTANCKNDYWGATIDIPKAFRGQNIVLSFDYRTEAASTNVTAADQWFVAVQDKTNTVAFLVTATALVAAGSAVGVVSSTGLAVGDKVWLEGGGNAQGSVSNDITEAYITEVTDATNIKLSAAYTPASTANSIGQTGFLTNTLQFLAAADSDTDKVGKNRKLAFKTADDTAQVNVFFQLRNTSSTVVHSLYFDNVYISSNMFLQASAIPGQSYTANYSALGGYSTGFNKLVYYGNENYNDIPANIAVVTNSTSTGFFITAYSDIDVYAAACMQATSTADEHVGWTKNLTDAEKAIAIYSIPAAKIITPLCKVNTNSPVQDPGGTFTLKKGDIAYLMGDGAGWVTGDATQTCNICIMPKASDAIILESQDEIFTDWQDFTPTFSTGAGQGTGSYAINEARWRRVGSQMEVYMGVLLGTTGASVAYVELPSGYSYDISKYSATTSTNHPVGNFSKPDTNYDSNYWMAVDVAYSNRVYLVYSDAAGYSYDTKRDWNHMMNNNQPLSMWFTVPIQGWNANFNPLLSMPLVDIGSNVGYYLLVGWSGQAGYSMYSTNSPTINTLGNLGTITNSSTEGFYFTASQRVKVTFNYTAQSSSTPDMGIGGGKSGLNFYSNSITGTHFDDSRLAVISAQDSTATEALSACAVLDPGEQIGIAWQTSTAGANSMGGANIMVEKDFSNTNMAHIIKPAVAIIQDEKPSNTASGAATVTGWRTRDLTVIKGESWFVTLDSNKFTLEPGTYEIFATAPFYMCENIQLRLYDVTNSVATDYGQVQYARSANYDSITTNLNAYKTITASTEYRLEYQVGLTSATNGLGAGEQAWGGVMIFSQVQIRKLK